MTRAQTIVVEGVEVRCINDDDGRGWCVDNPTYPPIWRLIRDGKLTMNGFDRLAEPERLGLEAGDAGGEA